MLKELLKKAFQPKVDVEAVIREIHNSFDTAQDEILAEAKSILAKEVNTDKGSRLQKLGFSQAKDVELAATLAKEKKLAKEWAETVMHFQTFYPNNKFITETMVEKICKKYNLVCAEVRYYKGDVPERNLAEIEAFKLRKEDMPWKQNRNRSTVGPFESYMESARYDEWMQKLGSLANIDRNSLINQFPTRNGLVSGLPKMDIQSTEPEVTYVQPAFHICAPEKDFDMTHLVRNGHKLEFQIPDPIVLQPVKGGYLIVSKWGLEASDELVVNEKSN